MMIINIQQNKICEMHLNQCLEKKKTVVLHACIKKEERSKITDLSFYLQKSKVNPKEVKGNNTDKSKNNKTENV